MKYFSKIICKSLILIFLFVSKSYAGATFVQTMTHNPDDYIATGIEFSKDGLRLTIGFQAIESWRNLNGVDGDLGGRDYIRTYTLTTAFDISTTNRGDRVKIKHADTCGNSFQQNVDIEFSNDGLKAFTTNQYHGDNAYDVCQITLSTAYDITTASSYTGIRLDDGDTDVGQSIQEAMGVTFNKDGTKMFVGYNNSSNTAQGSDPAWLYEFDLSTGFDVDTAKYNNVFIDLRSIGVNELTGMKFTPDGKTLFVLDPSQEVIHQFSLSKSFDLSSTFSSQGTFNDVITKHAEVTGDATARLYDLTFNNDGSKAYIAMSKYISGNTQASNMLSRLHEYDLDCPYGLVKCDPLKDQALMGLIEAQVDLAKNTIKHSTLSSLRRIEWIRRNRNNDNSLSQQNINLNFSNEMLSSLSKLVSASPKKKSNKRKKTHNWNLWSDGDISFTKVGAGLLSYGKKIKTNGITIGADKVNQENNLTGYSFRFGDDHVDVSSNAFLDQNSYTFMFYNSINENENKYFDSVIGISYLNIDQERYFKSWNSGERNGKQFFGTLKYASFDDKLQFYEKYLKLTVGRTILSEFTETGNDVQIRFDERSIKILKASSGLKLKNVNEYKDSNLTILGSMEHSIDFSPSSNQTITYANKGTQNYLKTSSSGQTIKGSVGIELTSKSGFSTIINYEREQSINGKLDRSSHSDNFYILLGYIPIEGTKLELASDENGNTSTNLNIAKKINELDFNLELDYGLINLSPNRNLYLSLGRKF